MPSPFPGMDPYLEHPGFWPGVHAGLIAVVRELLSPPLRPRFWVDIEERVYVEHEELPPRALRPGLTISTAGRASGSPLAATLAPGYVEVPEYCEVPTVEKYLVIRHLPDRKIVTVIEILSPTNKSTEGLGMSEYARKRNQVLETRTNLVEIDLLREGRRLPPALGIPALDYRVLVHRGWERVRAWAATWRLQDAIPAVPIPLLPDDAPVLLDLAHALRLVYDRGAYDTVLDYGKPPTPPLAPELHAWADAVAGAARPAGGA
ncbi:MAG: DUF4058 family protein [Planctomycetes bacterium]|nr:DUF4058 family protein [Planctomycetota bacterium]